jgi:hypothetical protein
MVRATRARLRAKALARLRATARARLRAKARARTLARAKDLGRTRRRAPSCVPPT